MNDLALAAAGLPPFINRNEVIPRGATGQDLFILLRRAMGALVAIDLVLFR